MDGSGGRHGEAGLPSQLSPSSLSSKIPVPVKMPFVRDGQVGEGHVGLGPAR